MSDTPSSLSDVLSLVGDAVKLLFTDALWMTAEVLQVSNGRHKYLELVEYDANRKEVAKGGVPSGRMTLESWPISTR